MKSRRQVVATVISSAVSQVILILALLLLPPTSSSSIKAATATRSSSSSLLLLFHLLLLSLLITSDSDFHFLLPSSPSRKRKGIFGIGDGNYRTAKVLCSSTSSSSSSSSPPSSSNSSQQQHPQLKQKQPDDDDNADDGDDKHSVHGALLLSDPSSFKLFFRLSSDTFEWLSGLLEPLLDCRDPVGSPLNLSPHLRLGIALFRLATGSPYSDISRRFSVSESAARFCTKQLCRVLCTNFRFWVAFSSEHDHDHNHDLQSVSAAFQALPGLPNCCGILATTRFQSLGHRTVAAQIVVDASSRILSVVVSGFRGHRPDSLLLESSSLYRDVQGGHILSSPPIRLDPGDGPSTATATAICIPQYLIAADTSTYPLLPWLMVPFSNPASSPQDDFNAVQHSMSRPALTALASLHDWGILSASPIIDEDISMAVACVAACSILHNVLVMRGDFQFLSDSTSSLLLHSQPGFSGKDEHYFCCSGGEQSSAYAIRDALAAQATLQLRTQRDRSAGH